MSSAPVVSIVTPSLNQGHFLAGTIRSILSQEGDFFLDYIIMDGCSTDDSVEIIQQFERRLAAGEFAGKCRGINYRWQSAVDSGQADALAKGFRLANGDIFSWLNSDDILLPGALKQVTVCFARDSSIALLYGNARYCDHNGTVIGAYPSEDFSLGKLAYFNFIPQPAAFFRRSAYELAGGINPSLMYAMDYDLWIRIAKLATCSHLVQFLAHYRLHDDAKTLRDETLRDNHEEGLTVAMKHFGWAPLNLLYGTCLYRCRMRLPDRLKTSTVLLTIISALCTIIRSLYLNRGVDRRDLTLLTAANLRKLFLDRRSILLGK